MASNHPPRNTITQSVPTNRAQATPDVAVTPERTSIENGGRHDQVSGTYERSVARFAESFREREDTQVEDRWRLYSVVP